MSFSRGKSSKNQNYRSRKISSPYDVPDAKNPGVNEAEAQEPSWLPLWDFHHTESAQSAPDPSSAQAETARGSSVSRNHSKAHDNSIEKTQPPLHARSLSDWDSVSTSGSYASRHSLPLIRSYSNIEIPMLDLSASNGSDATKKAHDRQDRNSQMAFLLELKGVAASPTKVPRKYAHVRMGSRESPESSPLESMQPALPSPAPIEPSDKEPAAVMKMSSSELKDSVDRKRKRSLVRILSSKLATKNKTAVIKKDRIGNRGERSPHGSIGGDVLSEGPSASEGQNDALVPEEAFYTFDELIVAVTSPTPNMMLQSELLATYDTFTTGPKLLQALLKRFKEADGAQSILIQLRCIDVIRDWFEQHKLAWNRDRAELLNTLMQFREKPSQPKLLKILKVFDTLLETIQADDRGDMRKKEHSSSSAPVPIMPTKLKDLHVLHIDPVELARQMTLIDQSHFMKLVSWEFLQQAWMKDDAQRKAPNIFNSIMRFNITSRWVVAEILREEDMKTRVAIIRHFLKTAEELIKLRNYNGLLQIGCALDTHAVFRLTKTFDALGDSEKASMARIRNFCNSSGNHRALWVLLRKNEMPCIPYLGMFLTTFNLISESHSSRSESGALNWSKRKLFTHWVNELTSYQKTRYDLRAVPIIKDYILNAEVFDDDTNYLMSYYNEPREGKERGERPPQMRHVKMTQARPRIDSQVRMRSFKTLRDRLKAEKESIVAADDLLTFDLLVSGIVAKDSDPKMISDVLTAYHFFCTSDDLLTALLDQIVLVKDEPDHGVIQSNVLRIIRRWIEDHWVSFERDIRTLNATMSEFWDEVLAKDPYKALQESFSQLLDQIQEATYAAPSTPQPLPSPSTPSSGRKLHAKRDSFSLVTIPAAELAQQITLRDAELFAAVRPWELVDKRWTWSSRRMDAPNICNLFEFQNIVSGWAAGELLSEQDLGHRREKLKKLVEIMNLLLGMKNFSGMGSIVAALSHPAVARLEKTFSALSKTERKTLAAAQDIMSLKGDFTLLWNFQNRAGAPSVPRLQMYLEAITRIEELHGVYPPAQGLIDYSKMRKLSSLLAEISRFQFATYSWEHSNHIKAYMQSAPIYDDETAEELSLFLEPIDVSNAPSTKPFALLTTFEKHELGFYESDGDWQAKFSVAPLSTPGSTKDELSPSMHQRRRKTALVGDVVDKHDVSNVKPLMRVVHGRLVIVGATIDKLIEIVTLRPEHSKESNILLNTFREFCKPLDFLEKLMRRWSLPTLLGDSTAAVESLKKDYETKLVTPVQQRIVGILNDWVAFHAIDFERSYELVDSTRQFLESTIALKFSEQAHAIRLLLNSVGLPLRINEQPPFALGPFPISSLSSCIALDFNPVEIARQITLIDQQNFSRLSVEDLIHPNIVQRESGLRIIDEWSYSLTKVVVNDVSRSTEVRNVKGKLLAHWCYVAQHLYSIKNWVSLVSVLRGIREYVDDTASWRTVPPDLTQLVLRLDTIITQPNVLRSAMYQSLESAKCIPPISPMLDEIYYIKTKLHPRSYLSNENGVIDFERCTALSEQIDLTFHKVKRCAYVFADVPVCQRWLLHAVGEIRKTRTLRESGSLTETDLLELFDYVEELESLINVMPHCLRAQFSLPLRPLLLSMTPRSSMDQAETASNVSDRSGSPKLSPRLFGPDSHLMCGPQVETVPRASPRLVSSDETSSTRTRLTRSHSEAVRTGRSTIASTFASVPPPQLSRPPLSARQSSPAPDWKSSHRSQPQKPRGSSRRPMFVRKRSKTTEDSHS